MHSLQEVDCLHDRGPQEIKWCLSAILALRDSLVVRQVMPGIYRIADIKVGQVFWKQTTSRSILVHTGSAAFPQGSLWRERPPEGRVNRELRSETATPPRCRTSGQKRGVAPSTNTPPVRRADAPGGGGDTRGAASLRGLAWDAENPCYPASHAMFGKSPGPQRGGPRPLREKRCGCQKRETAG